MNLIDKIKRLSPFNKLWMVCFLAISIQTIGQDNTTQIEFAFNTNDTIYKVCGGQLVELINNDSIGSYTWEWDLGDGSKSILNNHIKHFYNPIKSNEYAVTLNKISNDKVIDFHSLRIQLIGQEINAAYNYDTIYCIGQQAVLSIAPFTGYSYQFSLNNLQNGYTLLNDFNENNAALVHFEKQGLYSILISATYNGCSSNRKLPFYTATSEYIDLDGFKLIPKNPDGSTQVMICLGSSGDNNMEFHWGSYPKETGYNHSIQPEAITLKNFREYDEIIDTTRNIYFVKVICNSCNSCGTILFYPNFK